MKGKCACVYSNVGSWGGGGGLVRGGVIHVCALWRQLIPLNIHPTSAGANSSDMTRLSDSLAEALSREQNHS